MNLLKNNLNMGLSHFQEGKVLPSKHPRTQFINTLVNRLGHIPGVESTGCKAVPGGRKFYVTGPAYVLSALLKNKISSEVIPLLEFIPTDRKKVNAAHLN